MIKNIETLKSKLIISVVALLIVFVGVISVKNVSADETTCVITSTLKLGSKGEQVKCLQTFVGASPVDGSFGKMTKAKVMAWQKSAGLTADGIFGPKSNTKRTAHIEVSVSNPTITFKTTTTGPGNITSTTLNGSPSNVQVGEGLSDIAVLGFQIRADAGSDLNIQNLRVNLLSTGAGSTWPSRYISDISVWQGDTKVGSVDVASLSQNGTTYSATITLTGATVSANGISDFKIAVTSNALIDSGDAANSFNLFVDSIRYSDGLGAILTSSPTGIRQPVRFLKLLTSASVKLTLSEDSDNPRDRTITTNYTSLTGDVPLLKFKLTATGSDLYLGSLALPATAEGVTDANQISSYYKLKYNGRVISSFTDTQTGTTPLITFGDDTVPGSTLLDGSAAAVTILAGETASFEVDADIKAMCNGVSTTSPCTGVTGTEFDAGDTLMIDFPSATLQSDDVYVENQVGDQLSNSSTNRTGSATGHPATFRVQGVTATYVGNTFTPTKNTSAVLTSEQYKTTVTIAAVGNDFFINPVADYVPNTVLDTTQDAVADTAYGFNLAVLDGSNEYTTTTEVPANAVALSVSCTSGCIQQSLTSMKIPSGQTATFVITTTLTDGGITAGGYRVGIFSTNATDGTTLSAFTNNPSYNFITPISPDNFQ